MLLATIALGAALFQRSEPAQVGLSLQVYRLLPSVKLDIGGNAEVSSNETRFQADRATIEKSVKGLLQTGEAKLVGAPILYGFAGTECSVGVGGGTDNDHTLRAIVDKQGAAYSLRIAFVAKAASPTNDKEGFFSAKLPAPTPMSVSKPACLWIYGGKEPGWLIIARPKAAPR